MATQAAKLKGTTILELGDLRLDNGMQTRVEIDEDTVAQYAETFANKKTRQKVPPGEAVWDGEFYWLWDGIHRHHASVRAGLTSMCVNVRDGTQEDAQWLACGANQEHAQVGKRLTRADKQNAVAIAVARWPDRAIAMIADHIGVDHLTVANARKKLTDDASVGGGATARNPEVAPPPETTENKPLTSNPTTATDGASTTNNGEVTPPASQTKPIPAAPSKTTGRDGKARPASKEELERLHKKIDAYIVAHPTASNKEVATSCGCSAHTVKARREALAREALLNAGEDADAPRDGVGLAIPERLRSAFANANAVMTDAKTHFKALREMVRTFPKAPGGAEYRFSVQFKKIGERESYECNSLEHFMTTLEFAMPYACICPYCEREGKTPKQDCKPCHGVGWVCKGVWDRAPEDYRDGAIEHRKAAAHG